jgi:hypothetical protein
MGDFKCPSVKGDRLYVLLLFVREMLFAHVTVAGYRGHS